MAADAGLVEDGIFGDRTEAAVRPFHIPDVILQQPQPYDIVDDPIRIAGIGRGFEGTISTLARDANGTVLAQSFVQGGAMALSNFQGELGPGAIPSAPQGTLEVSESTGGDEGPPPDRVVVPIVFGLALEPT